MDIPIQKQEKLHISKKPSDMRLSELREKIAQIDAPKLKGEFHKRISFSFSCLAFIILGFGISLVVKHREKSINFGIAFLTAGVYYLLFIFGEALLEYSYIAPALGMWLPNIVVISIGGYLIFKHAYSR